MHSTLYTKEYPHHTQAYPHSQALPLPRQKIKAEGNTTYQNSCVALEDIGKGDDALLCMTNLTPCCQSPNEGKWFFPNRTGVFPSWD